MRVRRLRRVLLVGAAVSLAAGATALPASASGIVEARLPVPVVVEKGINGTIEITYTPAAAPRITPTGDLAVGFTCTSQVTESGANVTCDKKADGLFSYWCSAVDITAVGAFVPTNPVNVGSYCSDGSGGALAQLDTSKGLRKHADFPRVTVAGVVCAAGAAQAPATPYHVQCSFTAQLRQPIVGGITIGQATVGGVILVSTWGVLSTTDWSCSQSIGVLVPPTVTCVDSGTDHSKTQWYCDETAATAQADPGLPPVVPRVRAQLSCDNTTAAIPASSVVNGTISSAEVPTAAGGPVDTNATLMNWDTGVFICQAWGPANTPVPVAPWTVNCDEP
jgi:hypothetical protein